MNDGLLITLATAMARLITSIDMTSDEEVDSDLATGWFEDLAYAFDQLPPADRVRLAALFREVAERESRPDVRAAMRDLPESFGLEEDEA
ncbi:hypothetical protein ACFRR7_31600 [Streptomyces sp. NPDC056909]|uniref:hypothetical protein n=1 Tax=Streptomyces sp. NPDC056909 TaxID=3345963 RepID=UPI00369E31D6